MTLKEHTVRKDLSEEMAFYPGHREKPENIKKKILCKNEKRTSIQTLKQERTKTNLPQSKKTTVSVSGSQHEGDYVNP